MTIDGVPAPGVGRRADVSLRVFLVRLIALCVLPVLALSIALAVEFVRFAHAESERAADLLAHNAAAAIDHYLSARIGALQMLAESPDADDTTRWPELYGEAQGLRHNFGGQVIFAEVDGRMRFHTAVPFGAGVLSVLPRPDGVSAAALALTTGRPAVGDPFVGPIAHEKVVAIAAPVRRDGRTTYLLLNVIPTALFGQRLEQLALPAGWAVQLLDGAGRAVSHAGVVESDPIDGESGRSATSRLSSASWSVLLQMPRSDYTVPIVRAAVVMMLAVLGATLIGVAGSLWASRRLTAALYALSDPSGDPAVVGTGITELDAVSQRLQESVAMQAHAEADRIAAERRHLARMEEASVTLQLREGQLRSVFESASDAILTVDETQTLVMANRAAAAMFGYRIDELIGAPLSMLVPEASREQHARDVKAFGTTPASARPMGRRPDVTGRRAGGQTFPAEAAISHVHVDGRRLFTVIVRDITERHRAEAELQSSKARLEAALASMSDGVVITDAQGRFTHFNDAFVGYYRFADRAGCLKSLAEYPELIEVFLPTGERAELAQWAVSRALRGETGTNVEYHVRRKDSGETWIGSYSFAPIRDAAGAVVGSVVIMRDITDIKRVQAELKTSHADLQRLIDEQDKVQEGERQRIARELHDDLQQTLAAILMDVAALRAGPGGAAPGVPPLLSRIDTLAATAIASTRRIVNDLRPQMLEELGLVPALEALAAQFVERTAVACECHADEAAVRATQATTPASTCLFRVAQEALNNVAKHAQAREVSMRLSRPSPSRLSLRIRDDGKGLSADDRRKARSFGILGMTERVRAVGGTLRLMSALGAGTVVDVEVPLPEPADERES